FFASHPPHPRLLIACAISSVQFSPHWKLRNSGCAHFGYAHSIDACSPCPSRRSPPPRVSSANSTAPLNAHPSRLACRLLHPLCLASPTLSAYIPHPQLPRMRTHSVPVNCSGRPHASRPSHCPCTDAQHPAMCSATGMHLSGPMARRFCPRSPRPFRGCITLRDELTPLHSLPAPCHHLHIRRSSAMFSQCTPQKTGSAVSRSVRHGSVPRAPHIFHL
ncbi:hypothetical protein B0H13DRAFT_2411764, partial [Mycena leptocephala]